jgi:hypothetical protein
VAIDMYRWIPMPAAFAAKLVIELHDLSHQPFDHLLAKKWRLAFACVSKPPGLSSTGPISSTAIWVSQRRL